MHLTIAIIEDEQPAREQIGELVIQELSGETEVYIEKYEDAERFLKALEEKKDTAYPDVVISDIDLPGMNGIELGAKLKGDGIETYLVFLTSFAEFAADSYILEAYQYIMKRDMKDRLGDVLRRIAKEKKTSEQDFLWVGDHEKKLFYKDIICVSKVKGQKYSEYRTKKKVYRERMPLFQIQEQLGTDAFIMVGRSCLVNIEHIAGISAELVQLDNGDVIGAGRELIWEVKQKVTAYWRKN